MTHDADICFCGADPSGETDSYIPCACQCKECCERTQRVKRFVDMESLMKRLLAANIQPETLADMVWCLFEPHMEEKIRSEVTTQLRTLLKGIRLQSEIWGTSLDFEEARKPGR